LKDLRAANHIAVQLIYCCTFLTGR